MRGNLETAMISAKRAQAAFNIARQRKFVDVSEARALAMLEWAFVSEFIPLELADIVFRLESVGPNGVGRTANRGGE